jgi:hypothetical protein
MVALCCALSIVVPSTAFAGPAPASGATTTKSAPASDTTTPPPTETTDPAAEPTTTETPPETPEAPPVEQTEDEKRGEAANAFLEGSKFYELGQYPKAIERFERAWELSNEPLLLFNLGQANWKWFDVDPDAEHLRRAKQSFENYDKRMRGSEGYDPTEIQRFIERIDEQLVKAQETADQRRERELRALEESERRRLWIERERQRVAALNAGGITFITLGSVALAMGISGALLRTANKIVLDNSAGGPGQINLQTAEEDRQRRDNFLLGGQLAYSGFILGGVLLPIGITLKVLAGVRERRVLGRAPKADVAVTADGFRVRF